ncbi:hypothetical protein MRX96_047322 [Rhipicephalus microplus]
MRNRGHAAAVVDEGLGAGRDKMELREISKELEARANVTGEKELASPLVGVLSLKRRGLYLVEACHRVEQGHATAIFPQATLYTFLCATAPSSDGFKRVDVARMFHANRASQTEYLLFLPKASHPSANLPFLDRNAFCSWQPDCPILARPSRPICHYLFQHCYMASRVMPPCGTGSCNCHLRAGHPLHLSVRHRSFVRRLQACRCSQDVSC